MAAGIPGSNLESEGYEGRPVTPTSEIVAEERQELAVDLGDEPPAWMSESWLTEPGAPGPRVEAIPAPAPPTAPQAAPIDARGPAWTEEQPVGEDAPPSWMGESWLTDEVAQPPTVVDPYAVGPAGDPYAVEARVADPYQVAVPGAGPFRIPMPGREGDLVDPYQLETSALADIPDIPGLEIAAARITALPETLPPELPAEFRTNKGRLSEEELENLWFQTASAYNRHREVEDRATALGNFMLAWKPEVGKRLGFGPEGHIKPTGFWKFLDTFDKYVDRPVRSLVNTAWDLQLAEAAHIASRGKVAKPGLDDAWNMLKRNFVDDHGLIDDGENVIRSLFLFGGAMLEGDNYDNAVEMLTAESRYADREQDVAEWLTGAGWTAAAPMIKLLSGASDEAIERSRADAIEEGAQGGHFAIGLTGLMAVSPLNFASFGAGGAAKGAGTAALKILGGGMKLTPRGKAIANGYGAAAASRGRRSMVAKLESKYGVETIDPLAKVNRQLERVTGEIEVLSGRAAEMLDDAELAAQTGRIDELGKTKEGLLAEFDEIYEGLREPGSKVSARDVRQNREFHAAAVTVADFMQAANVAFREKVPLRGSFAVQQLADHRLAAIDSGIDIRLVDKEFGTALRKADEADEVLVKLIIDSEGQAIKKAEGISKSPEVAFIYERALAGEYGLSAKIAALRPEYSALEKLLKRGVKNVPDLEALKVIARESLIKTHKAGKTLKGRAAKYVAERAVAGVRGKKGVEALRLKTKRAILRGEDLISNINPLGFAISYKIAQKAAWLDTARRAMSGLWYVGTRHPAIYTKFDPALGKRVPIKREHLDHPALLNKGTKLDRQRLRTRNVLQSRWPAIEAKLIEINDDPVFLELARDYVEMGWGHLPAAKEAERFLEEAAAIRKLNSVVDEIVGNVTRAEGTEVQLLSPKDTQQAINALQELKALEFEGRAVPGFDADLIDTLTNEINANSLLTTQAAKDTAAAAAFGPAALAERTAKLGLLKKRMQLFAISYEASLEGALRSNGSKRIAAFAQERATQIKHYQEKLIEIEGRLNAKKADEIPANEYMEFVDDVLRQAEEIVPDFTKDEVIPLSFSDVKPRWIEKALARSEPELAAHVGGIRDELIRHYGADPGAVRLALQQPDSFALNANQARAVNDADLIMARLSAFANIAVKQGVVEKPAQWFQQLDIKAAANFPKSLVDEMLSDEAKAAPAFYSVLRRAVEADLAPEAGDMIRADQIKGAMKQGGVSDEIIESLDLDTYFLGKLAEDEWVQNMEDLGIARRDLEDYINRSGYEADEIMPALSVVSVDHIVPGIASDVFGVKAADIQATSLGRWVEGLKAEGKTSIAIDEFFAFIDTHGASPAAARTATPEFKAWFGDSKIVDDAGEPLVVDHAGFFDEIDDPVPVVGTEGMHFGTEVAADIRAGTKATDDMIRGASYEHAPDEDGVMRWWWKTVDGEDSFDFDHRGFDSEEAAKRDLQERAVSFGEFDETGLARTKAYLSIENPKRVLDQGDDWTAAIAEAKAEGHDGIVYRNEYEDKGSTSYIVFEANQVKSVENVGVWDSGSPSVLDTSEGMRRDMVKVIEDDRLLITAFSGATPPTMINAVGRVLRRNLADADQTKVKNWLAGEAKRLRSLAKEDLPPELAHLFPEGEVGRVITDEGVFTQLGEDLFARGFESYLATRRAPKGMKDVFDRLKEWLKAAYNHIKTRSDVEVSDEVRSIFDKYLLAKEPKPVAARPLWETKLSDVAPAPGQTMEAARNMHKASVEAALKRGDPVPEEVLIGYPLELVARIRPELEAGLRKITKAGEKYSAALDKVKQFKALLEESVTPVDKAVMTAHLNSAEKLVKSAGADLKKISKNKSFRAIQRALYKEGRLRAKVARDAKYAIPAGSRERNILEATRQLYRNDMARIVGEIQAEATQIRRSVKEQTEALVSGLFPKERLSKESVKKLDEARDRILNVLGPSGRDLPSIPSAPVNKLLKSLNDPSLARRYQKKLRDISTDTKLSQTQKDLAQAELERTIFSRYIKLEEQVKGLQSTEISQLETALGLGMKGKLVSGLPGERLTKAELHGLLPSLDTELDEFLKGLKEIDFDLRHPKDVRRAYEEAATSSFNRLEAEKFDFDARLMAFKEEAVIRHLKDMKPDDIRLVNQLVNDKTAREAILTGRVEAVSSMKTQLESIVAKIALREAEGKDVTHLEKTKVKLEKKINILKDEDAAGKVVDAARLMKNFFDGWLDDLRKQGILDENFSEELFFSRVDVAGYIPHMLSQTTRSKINALVGKGVLPITMMASFAKARKLKGTITEINAAKRVELAEEIIRHQAMSGVSPFGKEGVEAAGSIEGLRRFVDEANAADPSTVRSWDEMVEGARLEFGLDDMYEFFETNPLVLMERYNAIASSRMANAIFINDILDLFPMGRQFRPLYGDRADYEAQVSGYVRLSKVDHLQAVLLSKLPKDLRKFEALIKQQLAEGVPLNEILDTLKAGGVKVDADVVRAFESSDVYVPIQVAEYLNWMHSKEALLAKQTFGTEVWDGIHSWMKGQATIAALAHIGRNVIGNVVSASQEIGMAAINPVNQVKAMMIWGSWGDKWLDKVIKVGKYEMPVKEWREVFKEAGFYDTPLSSEFMKESVGLPGTKEIATGKQLGINLGMALGGSIAGAAAGALFGLAPAGFLAGGALATIASRPWNPMRAVKGGSAWEKFVGKSVDEMRAKPSEAIASAGNRLSGGAMGALIGSTAGPVGAIVGSAIGGMSMPDYIRMMGQLNQSVEAQARLSMAIGALNKGMDLDGALSSVNGALRDYSHLTPLERNILRRCFFFYTWEAGNVRFQLRWMAKRPRAARTIFSFLNGMQKGQFTEEEITTLPEQWRYRVLLRTGAAKIMSISGLPQEPLFDILSRGKRGQFGRGLATRIHPIPLTIMEQLIGGGHSVYYDKGWEELNNVRQAKNAPPLLKWMIGFPEEGEETWVPVYKDGVNIGTRADYRANNPELFYLMQRFPGWRVMHQYMILAADTFNSYAMDAGDPDALADPWERALMFTLGWKMSTVDWEAQRRFMMWRLEQNLLHELELRKKRARVRVNKLNTLEGWSAYGEPVNPFVTPGSE